MYFLLKMGIVPCHVTLLEGEGMICQDTLGVERVERFGATGSSKEMRDVPEH